MVIYRTKEVITWGFMHKVCLVPSTRSNIPIIIWRNHPNHLGKGKDKGKADMPDTDHRNRTKA